MRTLSYYKPLLTVIIAICWLYRVYEINRIELNAQNAISIIPSLYQSFKWIVVEANEGNTSLMICLLLTSVDLLSSNRCLRPLFQSFFDDRDRYPKIIYAHPNSSLISIDG